MTSYLQNFSASELYELALDSRIDLSYRDAIAVNLFIYFEQPLADVLTLTKEVQSQVLRYEYFRIKDYDEINYFGPVQGREISWVQDRESRTSSFEEVLLSSAIDPQIRAGYLEGLTETKREMAIID